MRRPLNGPQGRDRRACDMTWHLPALSCAGYTLLPAATCASITEDVCRSLGTFGGAWPDSRNPRGCFKDIDNKFYWNTDQHSTGFCSPNKPCVCEGVTRRCAISGFGVAFCRTARYTSLHSWYGNSL